MQKCEFLMKNHDFHQISLSVEFPGNYHESQGHKNWGCHGMPGEHVLPHFFGTFIKCAWFQNLIYVSETEKS